MEDENWVIISWKVDSESGGNVNKQSLIIGQIFQTNKNF